MAAVAVLGAGDLGGAVARALAATGAVRRIALVDDAAEVARGKALDIRQAGAVEPFDTDVTGTGDLAAVVGAAAIVLADRYGESPREWTGEDGLRLLARVRGLNAGAPIVCAGASQLGLVERGVLELGASRRLLFASATEALRAALVTLTSLEAGCGPRDVSLALLGRPPDAAFVPWNDAAIAGRRATDGLAPPAILRLDTRLSRLWPPGPLALAAAAARVVAMTLDGSPEWACVFGVPERDAPARGASLPATFSAAGAHLTVPRLSTRDRVRLEGVLSG